MNVRVSSGFSLLEVMIALTIMAMGLTGILTFFGSSQGAIRQADALTVATMLARQKMAEVVLDLEKRTTEGKFPEDSEDEDGHFEGRHENYAWKYVVKKVAMPMPSGGGEEGGAANPMQMFMQQLKLDEAIREVTLTVSWTVRDRERSFSVTTHLVKL